MSTIRRMISLGEDGVYGFNNSSAVQSLNDGNGRVVLVIDPEDREQCRILADRIAPHMVGNTNATQAALRWMLTPPRPPEPQGLGAVVEDDRGRLWVRKGDAPDSWSQQIHLAYTSETWDRVPAVRVLSEGWSE